MDVYGMLGWSKMKILVVYNLTHKSNEAPLDGLIGVL